MKKEENKELEKVIKIIKKALKDEGYEIKRYRQSKKYSTTAYDVLCMRTPSDKYAELIVDEVEDIRYPYTNKIERAKDKFESI